MISPTSGKLKSCVIAITADIKSLGMFWVRLGIFDPSASDLGVTLAWLSEWKKSLTFYWNIGTGAIGILIDYIRDSY